MVYNNIDKIKSVSDFIGAEEARKIALELEMPGRAGDLSSVLAKNGAVIQYAKEFIDNVQKYLTKIDVSVT